MAHHLHTSNGVQPLACVVAFKSLFRK